MDRNKVHDALADEVDRGLLEIIQGRLVKDEHGNVVFNPKTGEPLRERPPAADFNAAIRRLTSLGISKQINKGSAAAQLHDAVKAKLKLAGGPNINVEDDDEDDAATEVA